MEMDSAVTCRTFFRPNYALPWQIRRRWEQCLVLLENMEVRFSHIFREGNRVADILSNVALDFDGFRWWDEAIPPIYSAVGSDRMGQF